MNKTCQRCGAEYIAKHSGSVYCSDKCRSAAHYAKNKERISTTTSAKQARNTPPKPETTKVKGEIPISEIKAKISNLESELQHLSQKKENTLTSNTRLQSEINKNETSKAQINTVEIKRIEAILLMPMHIIYNTFLNSEYTNAILKKDRFPDHKLKHPYHFDAGSELESKVLEFKRKKMREINKHNNSIKQIDIKTATLSQSIEDNKTTIKSLSDDIRFTQARLTRYDALLASAE